MDIIEGRYFWMACDYDDAVRFRDYVINKETGEKEPNPRSKEQIEPRQQFFACYDCNTHFLYLNDLTRRSFLQQYLSETLQKDFQINNIYAPSTQIVITEAIRVLHTVEASRDAILTQMQALAKTLPEYSLVREMPCIGDTLAPRLIAEIGDVRRFHSKRALIAYAGIDAPPYQSGKFCANNRHISKRGNRYLRKTGYEVMQSYVMHKPANDPIFTFIEKKRGEGKSGKLAMVARMNKFLRVYYGKVTELYRSLPAIE